MPTTSTAETKVKVKLTKASVHDGDLVTISVDKFPSSNSSFLKDELYLVELSPSQRESRSTLEVFRVNREGKTMATHSLMDRRSHGFNNPEVGSPQVAYARILGKVVR